MVAAWFPPATSDSEPRPEAVQRPERTHRPEPAQHRGSTQRPESTLNLEPGRQDHRAQRWARERADELPGRGCEHPFGPEWDVYKVRGKIFMLLTELADQPLLTLKARPEDALALREQYTAITPGYHMNKKHWITLRPSTELDRQLVAELVTESYLLVLEGLQRDRRPVDPATFGVAPG